MEENQIQRYGRQILLREVGGRGQKKLLTRAVQVREVNPALSIAVELLAAAGSPIQLPPGAILDGFVQGSSLRAFNEDAQAEAPVLLSVGISAAPPEGAAIVVTAEALAFVSARGCRACFAGALARIGWSATPAQPAAPADQLGASAERGIPPPVTPSGLTGDAPLQTTLSSNPPRGFAASADPVTLGSLIALAAQRLLLDLSPESVGALALADGLPRVLDFSRCAPHAPSR
jgi:hypothetical protein